MGITKPEWHFYHFVNSDVGDECCLFDVRGGDRHLVISHRQVERREDGGASEGVECLIEPRQRKTIEFRRFVDATIVDAHASGSVFPRNHYDGRRPLRCRRTRNVRRESDAQVGEEDESRRCRFHETRFRCADVGITFSEDVELFFDEGTQFRFEGFVELNSVELEVREYFLKLFFNLVRGVEWRRRWLEKSALKAEEEKLLQ